VVHKKFAPLKCVFWCAIQGQYTWKQVDTPENWHRVCLIYCKERSNFQLQQLINSPVIFFQHFLNILGTYIILSQQNFSEAFLWYLSSVFFVHGSEKVKLSSIVIYERLHSQKIFLTQRHLEEHQNLAQMLVEETSTSKTH